MPSFERGLPARLHAFPQRGVGPARQHRHPAGSTATLGTCASRLGAGSGRGDRPRHRQPWCVAGWRSADAWGLLGPCHRAVSASCGSLATPACDDHESLRSTIARSPAKHAALPPPPPPPLLPLAPRAATQRCCPPLPAARLQDFSTRMYRIRRTCLEMLADRGYLITEVRSLQCRPAHGGQAARGVCCRRMLRLKLCDHPHVA